MKKIYLVIACFLPLSCETALFPDPVGPEREIALQARILTTDTLHTIHAAYSLHDSLVSAADLTIACYVNGECVAVTSDSEAETDQWKTEKAWRAYRFRADIHPGDSVRIEATGRDGTAMAHVKAPDAPPAPEVSVEKISMTDGGGYDMTLFRFRVRVDDLPGQRNWYRLVALGRQVVDEYRPEGHPLYLPDWTEEGGWFRVLDKTIDIQVDNTKDPFLNPDGRAADSRNPDYLANQYNMFSDELFEDGTVNLTLEARVRAYFKINNLATYSICSYRRSIAALFDLQSLSREDYLNSRMLEMQYFSLTGIPYVDGLLSEDIVPPDNVEGGIGFVTVRSVSRAVCDFGERELPDGNIFDWPLE